MKILLINEWYNPVVQNLITYFSRINPEFRWTGKRWYRKDFLPLDEFELNSLIPEPEALTLMQNGYYDFVIFSDGSLTIYNSSQLNQTKTKRIFIDTTDFSTIPKLYYENSEIYFKAQCLKSKEFFVANLKEQPKKVESDKIFRFCLTPSFKIDKFQANYFKNIPKKHGVFFIGSAWPQDRINLIYKIKQTDINFIGGLYNRKDLQFNNVVPEIVKYNQLSLGQYLKLSSESKVNLNLIGNGKNCFRQFEILYLGGFLMCQENDHYFSHLDYEYFYKCFNNKNFYDFISCYENNDKIREENAQIGHDYYMKNLHPRHMVDYVIKTIEDYFK